MEASGSGINPWAYTSPISSPEPDLTEPEGTSLFHGRTVSPLLGSADPFLPQTASSPERDELAQPLSVTTVPPTDNLQPILTMATTWDAGTGVTTVIPSSAMRYISFEALHEPLDKQSKNITATARSKKTGREYQAKKRALEAIKEQEITQQLQSLTRTFNNNISTLFSLKPFSEYAHLSAFSQTVLREPTLSKALESSCQMTRLQSDSQITTCKPDNLKFQLSPEFENTSKLEIRKEKNRLSAQKSRAWAKYNIEYKQAAIPVTQNHIRTVIQDIQELRLHQDIACSTVVAAYVEISNDNDGAID